MLLGSTAGPRNHPDAESGDLPPRPAGIQDRRSDRQRAQRADHQRRGRRAEKAGSPDLLDYLFQGYDWINRGINPESLMKARECFERARAIDPDDVNAMLGLVLIEVISTRMRSFEGDSERLAGAEELALKALAAEPGNAMAHLPVHQTRQAVDRRTGAGAGARPQPRLRPRPDRLRQVCPRPRRGDRRPRHGGAATEPPRHGRLYLVRFRRHRQDPARAGGDPLEPEVGRSEPPLPDGALSLRRGAASAGEPQTPAARRRKGSGSC